MYRFFFQNLYIFISMRQTVDYQQLLCIDFFLKIYTKGFIIDSQYIVIFLWFANTFVFCLYFCFHSMNSIQSIHSIHFVCFWKNLLIFKGFCVILCLCKSCGVRKSWVWWNRRLIDFRQWVVHNKKGCLYYD